VTLAGTLTTPRGPGRFPAVVLISGSGAQDRDSTIAGHKPFLLLADTLARRGIAVLRLDDRGVGGSTGTVAAATSEDFAGDAVAAVAFLTTRASIDAARIGLLGHSEGGLVAPMAATRSKAVAFLVLLAGPGLTGEAIMVEQAALIARAMGATDGQIAANRSLQEQGFAIVKAEADPAVRRERLRAVIGDAQAAMASTPWFRFFLTYDPAMALRQVRIPTLALNGEKDLQVPAKMNLAAIDAALRAGGNTQFTTRVLPDLNHLFQTAKTGLPNEYAEIEETMAPVVLETIVDWIGRR
jgi:pimeloyl-ACP methyl ester carboxylesterase